MYATLRGNVEVVEELAKAGADVSIRSQVGPAPAKATSMLKGGGGEGVPSSPRGLSNVAWLGTEQEVPWAAQNSPGSVVAIMRPLFCGGAWDCERVAHAGMTLSLSPLGLMTPDGLMTPPHGLMTPPHG
jgi:hypothetical protein